MEILKLGNESIAVKFWGLYRRDFVRNPQTTAHYSPDICKYSALVLQYVHN